MEDKQFNQLFDSITRCVKGVRELQTGQDELKTDMAEIKADVVELKTDVAELKEGQKRLEEGQMRLEKEIRITNRALNSLAGESNRTKARVDDLESRELAN